ncbi:MAG: ribose 5-phosphate isomerase B [Candidatus Hydrogenedens sp.]|nr:ribose 5-phosphate isomerase B [Candidatus Hydrogenedens sp.]
MKIAVGSDHAGFEEPPPYYKPALVEHLQALGHEVIDCGPSGPGSVDYPDFAKKVCEVILAGDAEMGVLLCGTGMGISMAANRFKGIRAAVCDRPEMAWLAREHNDANVLCLGKRLLSLREALNLIDIFLATPFSNGERHQRRVTKIDTVAEAS